MYFIKHMYSMIHKRLALWIILIIIWHSFLWGQLPYTNTPAMGIAYIGNAIESTDGAIYVCWVEDKPDATNPDPNGDTDKWIGISKSADEGHTWLPETFLSLPNATSLLNPCLTQDSAGRLYLGCQAVYANGSSIVLFQSIDGGENWNSQVLFVSNYGLYNPEIVTSNGGLYLTYIAETPKGQHIYYTASANQGSDWTNPAQISSGGNWFTGNSMGFTSDGLAVAFCDSSQVFFLKGTEDSLSTPIVILDSLDIQPVTAMIASPDFEHLGLLVQDGKEFSTLYYLLSQDGGETWPDAMTLSEKGNLACGAHDNFGNLSIVSYAFPEEGQFACSAFQFEQQGQVATDTVLFSVTYGLHSIDYNIRNNQSIFFGSDGAFHAFWIGLYPDEYYLRHTFWAPEIHLENRRPLSAVSALPIGPNPFQDAVSLILPLERPGCRYILYNERGIKAGAGILTRANPQLRVENLPNGIYFLHTSCGGNELYVNKLIKIE